MSWLTNTFNVWKTGNITTKEAVNFIWWSTMWYVKSWMKNKKPDNLYTKWISGLCKFCNKRAGTKRVIFERELVVCCDECKP